jgi:microsomal epoxide hydrolase
MPRGGHFAAMEEPQMLLNDIRKFARGLRGASSASLSDNIA